MSVWRLIIVHTQLPVTSIIPINTNNNYLHFCGFMVIIIKSMVVIMGKMQGFNGAFLRFETSISKYVKRILRKYPANIS